MKGDVKRLAVSSRWDGHEILVQLTPTGRKWRPDRYEVSGTRSNYLQALLVCKRLRRDTSGSDKRAHTCLLRRLAETVAKMEETPIPNKGSRVAYREAKSEQYITRRVRIARLMGRL